MILTIAKIILVGVSCISCQKLKILAKKDIYIDTTYPADTSGYYRKSPCSFDVQSPVAGDTVYVKVLRNINPGSGCVRRWDGQDSLFECVASGVESAPSSQDTLSSFCNSESWRITPNAFNLLGQLEAGEIYDNTNNARFVLEISSMKIPTPMNLTISVVFRMHSPNSTWFPLLGSYTGIYRSASCRNGSQIVSVSSYISGSGSWTFFQGLEFTCSDGSVKRIAKDEGRVMSTRIATCPKIVGFSVKQSKALFGSYFQSYPPNAISFICEKSESNSWFGYSNPNDTVTRDECPENQVLVGFQGYFATDTDRINGISIVCRDDNQASQELIDSATASKIIFIFFGTCTFLFCLFKYFLKGNVGPDDVNISLIGIQTSK